jgi:hydroxymethylbilane synthase
MIHAAILSADSLIRLGASRRITQYLDAPGWLPAAGQGIVAIEIREDDDELREIVGPLDHPLTSIAARAERAFLAELEGVPQMPIAVLAMQGATAGLVLHALVSDAAARNPVRGSVEVDRDAPEASGRELATEMRNRGVASLLLELRNADKFQA